MQWTTLVPALLALSAVCCAYVTKKNVGYDQNRIEDIIESAVNLYSTDETPEQTLPVTPKLRRSETAPTKTIQAPLLDYVYLSKKKISFQQLDKNGKPLFNYKRSTKTIDDKSSGSNKAPKATVVTDDIDNLQGLDRDSMLVPDHVTERTAAEEANEVDNTKPSDSYDSTVFSTTEYSPRENDVDPSNAITTPQTDMDNLIYTNHKFYRSALIGDKDTFSKHWDSIANKDSLVFTGDSRLVKFGFRDSFYVPVNFTFPFYSRKCSAVAVNAEGFIAMAALTPDIVYSVQFAAPLRAHFHIDPDDDSSVLVYQQSNNFSVVWKNVATKKEPNDKFTFAVTVYKNGDITFAYKDIPKPVISIRDAAPVVVGLQDVFVTKFANIDHQTLVSYPPYSDLFFQDYDIRSDSILKLIRLPTCAELRDCGSCTTAKTAFKCQWCPLIDECSGGLDASYGRFQKWCRTNVVFKPEKCPAPNSTVSTIAKSIDLDFMF